MANRLSMTSVKRSSKTICGDIPSCETMKNFLMLQGKNSKSLIKLKLRNLLILDMIILRGFRNYILKIVHFVTRLREVNITKTDDFIVHHVLNSLPVKYEQQKISYIALRINGASMN